MPTKFNHAFLISGGGTTAAHLIHKCLDGNEALNQYYKPALVIASREGIDGIGRVIKAGMRVQDVVVIDPRDYKGDRQEFAGALMHALKLHEIETITQNGWIPTTPSEVIAEYRGRILNQHPGPLDPGFPDFGGQHMIGRAVHAARLYYEKNTQQSGRTMWTMVCAHHVVEELDQGAIVAAGEIEFSKKTDVISLQERCLPVEHNVQEIAMLNLAHNTVSYKGYDDRLIPPETMEVWKKSREIGHTLFPNG